MSKLTGYELSRQWFDFSFENPEKVKPVHGILYFFAIEHYNRLGQKEKFGFPSQMVMDAIGIKNWKTYSKTLTDLVDWGFLTMIEKSSNQYTSNVIALVKNTKAQYKAQYKALDKAMLNHSPKHDPKHSPKQVRGIVSIDKPTKQLNTKRALFFKFWEIYDLNKGETNAKSFWFDLTDEEIEKVFENVQNYVDSTPDKNFRAKPENYILKKIFNDEIVKKEKSSAKKENVFDKLQKQYNELTVSP